MQLFCHLNFARLGLLSFKMIFESCGEVYPGAGKFRSSYVGCGSLGVQLPMSLGVCPELVLYGRSFSGSGVRS